MQAEIERSRASPVSGRTENEERAAAMAKHTVPMGDRTSRRGGTEGAQELRLSARGEIEMTLPQSGGPWIVAEATPTRTGALERADISGTNGQRRRVKVRRTPRKGHSGHARAESPRTNKPKVLFLGVLL